MATGVVRSLSSVALAAVLASCGDDPLPAPYQPNRAVAPVFEDAQAFEVRANVPPHVEFDALIRGALQGGFFATVTLQRHIEYELLRDRPRRVRVASAHPGALGHPMLETYPIYYAWVTLFDNHDSVAMHQCAVALAAIDRTEFRVVDQLSEAEILVDPSSLDRFCPLSVGNMIRAKLRIRQTLTMRPGAVEQPYLDSSCQAKVGRRR
jgi:hypothetical protein